MPNWNSVLQEIQGCQSSPIDDVRRKYVSLLQAKTGRNIIAYYSAYQQKPSHQNVEINDLDKNGFMNAVHELDRSLGLDLILHTPGGDMAATESIVDYLYQMFNRDIRAIVPQSAMSGGTMIACACREILMGKESHLGPVDPQFQGIPAAGVKEEVERAKQEIAHDPRTIPFWQVIISKYHPTFIDQCEKSVDLTQKLVSRWLHENMFHGEPDGALKARQIAGYLSDYQHHVLHSRHIPPARLIEKGLKIVMIEDDPELQDLELTVHHCYVNTLGLTPTVKIIENHLGRAMVNRATQ